MRSTKTFCQKFNSIQTKKIHLLETLVAFDKSSPTVTLNNACEIFLYQQGVQRSRSVAYAENFHGERFIQWHMVVICI